MKHINRLLIANRGEIAVRIIRSCRQLGIHSILAASEADRDSLAARLADQLIIIGPGPSARSYLKIDAILQAAQQSQADAIHPGYGFLSENAALARACQTAGIIFVGPTAEQLDALGDKLLARQNAVAAGLPIVPGGTVDTHTSADKLTTKLGYPVLIKAVSGGGGRGMKVVHEASALAATLDLAMAEADTAFGDSRVYLETYVQSGRHVEVQVLGDGRNVIHLGTRDCSIQRRYQKLVEEAPAPNLPDELRHRMENAAVDFARHLAYCGAGTVEFLVDMERQTYYFLEMNARIQVEHPVTEAITGLDLVAEQIRLAEGRPLRLQQGDTHFSGHAIECRLNAEDIHHDFRPDPGSITSAIFPAGPGIRVDTHIETGSIVPPYYDSLLAKLIVHGQDRLQAITRLQQALKLCRIEGLATNLALHQHILNDPAFIAGGIDTRFLPTLLEQGLPDGTPTEGDPHG